LCDSLFYRFKHKKFKQLVNIRSYARNVVVIVVVVVVSAAAAAAVVLLD